jgi:hypothetical protein
MTATLSSLSWLFSSVGRRAAAFIQNEWTLIASGGICHSLSRSLTLREHDPSLNYSPERTYLLLLRTHCAEHTRLDFVYLADARERRNLFAIQLISVPRQVGVVIGRGNEIPTPTPFRPGCIARIDKQPHFWRVSLLDTRYASCLYLCSLKVVEICYRRWCVRVNFK